MGGLTQNTILFLELFIPKNRVLFYLISRKETYKVTSKAVKILSYEKIYILINNNSLSSSEIVANVMKQKMHNVTIIGNESGGKNIITKVFKYKNLYIKIPCFTFMIDSPFNPNYRLDKLTPDYYISDQTVNKFLQRR